MPVRQMTIYLLPQEYRRLIRTEAMPNRSSSPTSIIFVDELTVSPELKAWMKNLSSVELLGADFTKSLTPEDIMDVPEFFKAYMTRNVGFQGNGFPDPKFKAKDKEANPGKVQPAESRLRGSDSHLLQGHAGRCARTYDIDTRRTLNPGVKWNHLVSDYGKHLEERTFDLAQQKYLAGQADTDLDGRGSFSGLAPGTYWVGLIGIQAMSGDVRLRWDYAVTVRPGETARVELNNLNAIKICPLPGRRSRTTFEVFPQ